MGEVCRKALALMGAALAKHGHVWSREQRETFDLAIDILNMHWPEKS